MSYELTEFIFWEGVGETATIFARAARQKLQEVVSGDWELALGLIKGAVELETKTPITFPMTAGGMKFYPPNNDRQPHVKHNGVIIWEQPHPKFVFSDERLAQLPVGTRIGYRHALGGLMIFAFELGLAIRNSKTYEFTPNKFSSRTYLKQGAP